MGGGTLAPTICQIFFLCNDSAVISDSRKQRTDIYPHPPQPRHHSPAILCHRVYIRPLPAPQLRSFHHSHPSLACCAFSPHRFTAPLQPPPPPLRLPTSPVGIRFPSPLPLLVLLCRHATPTAHLPQTASAPPLLDSIPPLPAATRLLRSPSFPGVTMHHAISYRFVTFRFSLGIHNPLHVSLSVFFCSSRAVFHLVYMKQLSAFHQCPRLCSYLPQAH